ncbi:sigma-70 family RNA polymerase sigma factor [Leptobacterium flavescens]|uniref:RNA polymerase sigma factor n=1 Tax=Leptobacterium flavescens TaxID=472055 RepID=A0A6P0UNS6_9FLAO|nr:RNA polymerase sigma factor [Leptobacterium flavescens]NER14152.1 sigma-70 family RNA polymerase sigma factor [Leptobacterium flavescens]
MKEEEFIRELQQAKQSAYSRLIEDYQQKVFSTCMSFVPNKEDAEDIAQEVFVEVFNSIQKFKGNSKLSTWIYRIAVNKCLEFIRKKNTKKRFAFMQSVFGKSMPADKSSYFTEFNHPGVLLANKEQSEILFKAIDKLPKDQKVVFTLHKIEGLSYKEIGTITEKSLSSVESLMFRAKKNLQKLLHSYYKSNYG